MMQILKKSLISIAMLLFLTACGGTDEGTIGTISDFFPFGENVTFVIENEEQPHANQEIFTTHISGNRVQQSMSALNINHALVLELDGGTLRQIYTFIDHPIYEDITDASPNMNWVILQEPLSLGNYWSTGDGNATSTITAVGNQVITPAGTFDETIQVTTEFPNGDYSVTYFAVGHGMIYDSWSTTFEDITAIGTNKLVHVREGAMQADIPVFFPHSQLAGLDGEMIVIDIYTNQDFPLLFTQILQQKVNLLENVSVNDITVNRDSDLVVVDFSGNFLEIEVDAILEELLLNSLANTFGMFYNVGYFQITLEGENYSSEHFTFNDGDFIAVGEGFQ